MKLPLPRTLRFRLVMASVLVELVLLALLIANSVRLIDRAARASVQASLDQVVPMLNAAIAPYLLERDYAGLQDFLGAFVQGQSRELSYASISEADGVEVARVGLERGVALAPPSESVEQAVAQGEYRSERPVMVGGQKLGMLRIGLSTRIAAETRAALVRQGSLIAGLEILASVLVLSLLGLWLTHHLERAAAASRAIGDGDYTRRLPEQGGAEVAELARAVNRMGQEVEQREQALHRLNLELEVRIAERTHALQQSLLEQSTILDNAIVGILFLRNRIILRCNRGWAEMLGYSIPEMEGKSTRMYYVSDEAYEQQGMLLYPSIMAGHTTYGEASFRRKDGSTVECSFQGKAIDPGDMDKGSIWVLQDITARKAAERSLEQRSRDLEDSLERLRSTQLQLVEAEKQAALGQLVAGMAHELNTPIGNILTAASGLSHLHGQLEQSMESRELTRSRLLQSNRQAHDVSQLIERNAERAAQLIERFKLVAADQREEQRRVFAAAPQVRAVLEGFEHRLQRRGVAVHAELAQEIILDNYPGMLVQVLVTLLNNVLDHAFDGVPEPQLWVRLWCPAAGRAEVAVRDNGSGIAGAALARVFEPFYTTRRGAGHAGLGLHILHNLVTAMGGEVRIDSTPGGGTSVTIGLPCILH
ncbi:ATP-binding protein [Pseudoduganella violaceinigra]|uniref:ATP-binding protein n=1 Tax=Pseudoduganella violaceinigra TaxID=246602 RepID=UPI0004179D35|nr:ATP-binding protein [Pseudoduganella violaceinigra]